jgi:hypothetical protein
MRLQPFTSDETWFDFVIVSTVWYFLFFIWLWNENLNSTNVSVTRTTSYLLKSLNTNNTTCSWKSLLWLWMGIHMCLGQPDSQLVVLWESFIEQWYTVLVGQQLVFINWSNYFSFYHNGHLVYIWKQVSLKLVK